MKFNEVLDKRYSVRNYLDREVEGEKIQAILKSSCMAPTARNSQCQKIYVVKNKEMLCKLFGGKPLFSTPLAFVVCGDKNSECKTSYSKRSLMETDLSIITTYMMLTATSLSLGSCWVCRFDEKEVSKILNLPENIVPCNILLVGYEGEDSKPNERHFIRKTVEETCTFL